MEYELWIGGYGDGITRARLAEGRLTALATTPAVNPSYLMFSADQSRLYAVNETTQWRGQMGGALSAWAVEADGTLRFLAEQFTGGKDPCYLSGDREGRHIYAANYSSGTLSTFALSPEGLPLSAATLARHEGCGPNAARQSEAHVHCAQPTPDGSLLSAVDLGIDKVVFYEMDGLTRVCEVSAPAGSGPRHIVFLRDDLWYVVCELNSTVLTYRGRPGEARLDDGVSALHDPQRISTCAAIKLSPDQKLLLATNRGEDSLALFDVAADGTLHGKRVVSCEGRCPRDASFSPDGRFAAVANQESDDVALFAVRAGNLEFTGARLPLKKPACILWR